MIDKTGVSSWGILADQLTLSQKGREGRLKPINNTGTPGFSDLPTALHQRDVQYQISRFRDFFHGFFPKFLDCASLKNYGKKTRKISSNFNKIYFINPFLSFLTCNDHQFTVKQIYKLYKGAFTNYVYKRRGVGGQKKPNLVNVVCERPLKDCKVFFNFCSIASRMFKYTANFLLKRSCIKNYFIQLCAVRNQVLYFMLASSNPLVSPTTTVNTSKTPHQLENFPLSILFLHLTVLISFTYQFEYEKKIESDFLVRVLNIIR